MNHPSSAGVLAGHQTLAARAINASGARSKPPGQHTVVAVINDKSGRELCRVAPRLVSAGWTQGY